MDRSSVSRRRVLVLQPLESKPSRLWWPATKHRRNPSIDQVPAFSDDWMALAFTKRHGIELRYCAQWSKWLIWDGTRWKIDETKEVFDRARKICREVAVECNEQKASKLLASSKTVAAVKTLAESDRQHAMTSDQWDADPRLLNTPGGTIDLCTGEMRAHSPDDYVTLTTACAWWRMSKLVRVS